MSLMVVVPLLATWFGVADVGVEMGVAAVLGSWSGSDGGGYDDVDFGDGGGPEPIFLEVFVQYYCIFGYRIFLVWVGRHDI